MTRFYAIKGSVSAAGERRRRPTRASATLKHLKVHVARISFGGFGPTTGMSNTPRRP
jgi:hypothetical protein